MRTSLLCVVVLVGCASEPTQNVVGQAAEGEYCQVPPLKCYPLEDGPRYCGVVCNNNLAYCRDYPDSSFIYCYKHPGMSNCNSYGEPDYATECVQGAPASPPERDPEARALRQRVMLDRFARRLAEHGLVEQASETLSRAAIR